MELLLAHARRVFVLHSNTAVTAPVFSPRTLATAGQRMDVVARAAMYALWDTGAPRSDTLFIAVLNGPPNNPLALYFSPFPISPSEERIGAEILKALSGAHEHIIMEQASTEAVVTKVKKSGFRVVLLIENGREINSVNFSASEKYAFVVGDQIGFPASLLRKLRDLADFEVSLGPRSYLAEHCIAFIHEVLDAAH